MTLNETHKKIKKILEQNYHARVSDNAAILVYYEVYENVDVHNTSLGSFFRMMEYKHILSLKYVERCIRKVKETYPELGRNEDSRDRLENDYKEEFSN